MQNIIQDELGRTITLHDNTSTILRGTQSLKANHRIVLEISNFLKTSLGPFGRDKILTTKDGNVIITNDGATILKNMELEAPVAKIIMKLSESLDDEIGDGTTSVVLLASALLTSGVELVSKGLHPTMVIEAFGKACGVVVQHLQAISDPAEIINEINERMNVNSNISNTNVKTDINTNNKNSNISNYAEKDFGNEKTLTDSSTVIINANNSVLSNITTDKSPSSNVNQDCSIRNISNNLSSSRNLLLNSDNLLNIEHPYRLALLDAAKTSLGSKIVAKSADIFAKMCVDAVLHVFDFSRDDLNFEHIKIHASEGSDVSSSALFTGVLLSKERSHPEMPLSVQNGKVAVLTCPFEPPKLKTKHFVNISTVEEYNTLSDYEVNTFKQMIAKLVDLNVKIVFCQWGFDDEANSLLAQNNIFAVRWVGGTEIEQLAIITGAQIIARFEDLTVEDLGSCSVEEVRLGTEDDKALIVTSQLTSKMVTLCVRANNQTVLEEAKRSVHDALCAVRNLLISKRIVYGGGASEISASNMLRSIITKNNSEKECFLAMSNALDEIAYTLAMNIGQNPVNTVSQIKQRQIIENSHSIGVSIHSNKGECMQKLKVYDALISKQKQIAMAVQMVCSILKIDDVIVSSE